jgi:MFS transporter, DHA1 family, multidrug resistance protein
MGMALTPMVAPMIGGVLDQLYGWQSTFLLIFVFGWSASPWSCSISARPTAALRLDAGPGKAYPELLTSRRFWGYSLTAAFASGSFFAFLGGGPFVASEIWDCSRPNTASISASCRAAI